MTFIRFIWIAAWSSAAAFLTYLAVWVVVARGYGVAIGRGDEGAQTLGGWAGVLSLLVLLYWGHHIGRRALDWMVLPLRLLVALAASAVAIIGIRLAAGMIFKAQIAGGGGVGALISLSTLVASCAAMWLSFVACSEPLPSVEEILVQVDRARRAFVPRGRLVMNAWEESIQYARSGWRHRAGAQAWSTARIQAAADRIKAVMLQKAGHAALGEFHRGGVDHPGALAMGGFCAFGAPGSGKTNERNQILRPVLTSLRLAGPHRRVVLYDYKQEDLVFLLSRLRLELGVKVVLFNPFDKRTAVPDFAADLATRPAVEQAVRMIFREVPGTSEAFWVGTATNMVFSALCRLRVLAPDFTLRDLVLVLSSPQATANFLRAEAATSDLAELFFSGRATDTTWGVLMTISKEIRRLAIPAALWHRAEELGARRYSIGDWMNGSEVVVLGNSLAYPDVVSPVMATIFQLMVQTVFQRSRHTDAAPELTWFALDEVANLKVLPLLPELARTGRSFGCRPWLGIQDIPALRSVYGNDAALSILGTLTNKSFYVTDEAQTAQFASESLGAEEIDEYTRSFDEKGDSKGTQRKRSTRPLFPEHVFRQPNPPGKLRGWFKSQGLGVWSHTTDLGRLDPVMAPPTREELETVAFQEADDVALKPWSDEERQRLGLNLQRPLEIPEHIKPPTNPFPRYVRKPRKG